MILIHGDCGNGKSRALQALELAPPADLRAVYVPVPTLEFAGLARWCLDRLNDPPGEDPIAAFRAVVGQRRVLVLVDDAPRLPLETALALRQFERDAKGNLAIVAACVSEEQRGSSVVALGEPAARIALDPERGRGAEAVAADVRAALSGGAEQRSAAPRPQQLAVRAREAPRVTAEPARARELPAPAPRARELPMSATASAPAPSPALVAIAKPPRTVPLNLAVALACTAFLVPVAFGAGFVFGRQPAVAELAASASPDLPPVASAPPEPSEHESAGALAAVEPLAPTGEEPEKSLARETVAAGAGFASDETAAAPEPLPAVAAPTPRRVVASAPSLSARSSDSFDSSSVVESWGAPSLISVAPASDAP